MTLLRCLLIMLMFFPTFQVHADDELVVVDEAELDRYWRVDGDGGLFVQPPADGPQVYGCVAVPIIIDTNGSVSPRLPPLLSRIGQGPGEAADARYLHQLTLAAMPYYQSTWNTPPSDAIFTTRTMTIVDPRLVQRLGPEQTDQLVYQLTRACRIDGLAEFLGQQGGRMVDRPLPPDPAQWLAQQQP